MIRIRFPNAESKRAALGKIAGRFSFKVEGIGFFVEGPATYEQSTSALRGSPAPSV
jgi:hypothetical protein